MQDWTRDLLHAWTPPTRLDAMTTHDSRRAHAEDVSVIAMAALDVVGDPLRADATDDRSDLANLLAAIGEAWTVALDSERTFDEQLRWSKVCTTAQVIAQRIQHELDEEERIHAEQLKRTRRRGIAILRRPT